MSWKRGRLHSLLSGDINPKTFNLLHETCPNYTSHKQNMAPENRHLQKEMPIGNPSFLLFMLGFFLVGG